MYVLGAAVLISALNPLNILWPVDLAACRLCLSVTELIWCTRRYESRKENLFQSSV